ncbi:MAG: F0F1 ATP synthase subunit gamma [Lachnospiraceae bacterium]|nr:F0F1 ATP synthase subunit gamma [Lachnospiraceae bacterium]
MSIRSVVKVMNFHSLLRVDKSRNKSKKYTAMEQILTRMIDNIVNNRNISLDYKMHKVDPTKPELNIYIGSDMGFCSNLNALVKKTLGDQAEDAERDVKQIVIGRKIKPSDKEKLLLFQTREEYDEDNGKVMGLLEEAIRERRYSKISIVYNHYYNSSQVALVDKQIYPVPKGEANEEDDYKEDFSFEGNVDDLLVNMVVLYVKYSMEIAAAASYASENISRQNVTTESLNKLDERDEIRLMEERRRNKDKQFAKVLDNYTKTRAY